MDSFEILLAEINSFRKFEPKAGKLLHDQLHYVANSLWTKKELRAWLKCEPDAFQAIDWGTMPFEELAELQKIVRGLQDRIIEHFGCLNDDDDDEIIPFAGIRREIKIFKNLNNKLGDLLIHQLNHASRSQASTEELINEIKNKNNALEILDIKLMQDSIRKIQNAIIEYKKTKGHQP